MSDRLRDAQATLDAYRREQDARQPDLFSQTPRSTHHDGLRSPDKPRPWWWTSVFDIVDELARMRGTFTVDDVRDQLEPAGLDLGDVDLRALGAVLTASARAGAIEATDQSAPSRRRNRSPLRVWRSRKCAA